MAKTSQQHDEHIVLIPTPGMGHLIPIVQLAHRILNSFPSVSISIIVPTTAPPSSAQRAILDTLPAQRAHSSFLPLVDSDDLPPDTKIETRISVTLARSLPLLRESILEITSTRAHPTVLVVDLFGTDAFDLCSEFAGMKPYLFFPSTATSLSFLSIVFPELDVRVSGEFRDMDEPVRIPGFSIPVHGKYLLDPVQDRKNDAYKWFLHHGKKYKMAEGILVNTFIELEEGAINALQKTEPGMPPVYPVGPLVRTGADEGEVDDQGSECLTWLNKQPRGSVTFVSFGSGGALTYDQFIELANGLELSEKRFLWVVRAPNDVANATFFENDQSERDPLDLLPKGFLERTKDRGLVVRSWAPQMKVLGHVATGAFVTHCGWNSILESVVNGVPMITWPLYAEQKMNAIMLTEDLKVALRPKADPITGLIGREEITKVVTGLMEGEEGSEIRKKMIGLKNSAAKTLGENGASTKALSEVALKWKLSQKSVKNVYTLNL